MTHLDSHPVGITVRTTQRHAAQLAALLSPTRSFEPVRRGTHFLPAVHEVQALRDYDFLVSQRLVMAEAITLHEGQ